MIGSGFKEILTSEIISMTGGLAAGFLLTFAINKLEMIPGILVLLPGLLEMRGNISGALSARLSAGLHVGALRSKYNKNRILKGNIIATFVLVILLSLFLGLMAFYVTLEVFGVSNPNIVFLALIAGILSNLIEVPLTIMTTFWLFNHGHDPNNIMGPYVTTTGDIISIVALLIGIAII